MNHSRNDDIVEFARGNIMYRVGENGYVADVLVGIRRNGAAVLYDLVNIYEKNIAEAQVTMVSNENSQRRHETSATNILFDSTENVKRDVFGFAINENAEVNEDLLEDISYYHPEAQIDEDGNVTVYHRTTKENAEAIKKSGIMYSKEDAVFFSSKKDGQAEGYGDTVIELKIPSTELRLNDVFDGEVHFDVPAKRLNNNWSLDVSEYLSKSTKQYSLGDDIAPAMGNIYGKDIKLQKNDKLVIEDAPINDTINYYANSSHIVSSSSRFSSLVFISARNSDSFS